MPGRPVAMSEQTQQTESPSELKSQAHWTARHGKPVMFVILTLVAAGIYLAFTIPVSVFPSTEYNSEVTHPDAFLSQLSSPSEGM